MLSSEVQQPVAGITTLLSHTNDSSITLLHIILTFSLAPMHSKGAHTGKVVFALLREVCCFYLVIAIIEDQIVHHIVDFKGCNSQ